MFISEAALHGTAQLVGGALVICIILFMVPESWWTPKKRRGPWDKK